MKRFSNTVIAVSFLAFVVIVPARAQWEQTNIPSGAVIDAFATIGSNVFAGGYIQGGSGSLNCVLLTTDNGSTWTNTNVPGIARIWTLFADGPNLLAGSDSIYLTTNNGISWSASSVGPLSRVRPISVRAIAAIGTNIFAGDYSGHGIFLSLDNGSSWTAINNGLLYDTTYASYGMCDALASMGTNLFAGMGGAGVFRSTDSGKSWIPKFNNVITGGYPPDFYSLVVVGNNLYAGSDYGVFLSSDSGNSWVSINNGLISSSGSSNNIEADDFAVSCNNIYVGIFGAGIFSVSNNDTSWTDINGDLTVYNNGELAIGENGNFLFASPWASDTSGIWRLLLDDVILENQQSDTVLGTECSASNFSFNLQTIGGCTFPTLDSVFIAGLDSTEYQILRSHNPSGVDTVWVTVRPETAGTQQFNVTARYTNDSDVVADTTFTLTLEVAPSQSLSVYLKPAQLSDTSQGIVPIPIYASSATGVTSDSISFRLNLRTDLLTPVSITSPVPGAVVSLGDMDDSGVSVTLVFPPGFSILADTLVATVECQVFVTDTNATAITVAGSSPSGSGTNCLSITDSGAETFMLNPECSDPTLIQFLQTGSLPSMMRVFPNPATNTLNLVSPTGTISISDPLGRSYAVPRNGNEMDISTLPSGVYFLSDGVSRAKFVKE